jgi:hypothetical protein
MRPWPFKFSCYCGGLFLLLVTLLNPVCPAVQEFDQTHSLYDGLLKAHVIDGRVDYATLKADPKDLDRYLAPLAGVSEKQFASWDEALQLAFLFNLYNASTLRLIRDYYPVASIKDIGGWFQGPWDQPVVQLFGKHITLNTLEHDILRKQYKEPRLHMALVCAARGCPPLRSEAYTAAHLQEQLDDQARRLLADPGKFRIDRGAKTVYFSSIFKWYGADFQSGYTPSIGFAGLDDTERAVANFCARYLSGPDREYLEVGGYAVGFLDYDWSLNGQKIR